MRNFLMIAALMAAGCATVEPGSVVARVDVCAGDGSQMDVEVMHGGRYWPAVSPCVDYYVLPIKEKRDVWTKNKDEGSASDESINVDASDGTISVDVGVGWQIDPENIQRAITQYGKNPSSVVDSRVRDSVRSYLNMCAAELTVSQIYSVHRQSVFDCALERTQEEYNAHGLIILRLTLNEIRLPQDVRDMMQQTLQAAQKGLKAIEEVASREHVVIVAGRDRPGAQTPRRL